MPQISFSFFPSPNKILSFQESGIIFSRQFFPMGLFVPNNKPDYTEPLKAFGMSEFFLALVLAGVGLVSALGAFVYELVK